MKWTAEKLKQLMALFEVSNLDLADWLHVHPNTISGMKNKGYSIDAYQDSLQTFFEEMRDGAIEYHQKQIELYKNAL